MSGANERVPIYFAETEVHISGDVTWRTGQVVRRKADKDEPWANAIILGFAKRDAGDYLVRLARPYVAAMLVFNPVPLMAVETLQMSMESLVAQYERLGWQHGGYSGYTVS